MVSTQGLGKGALCGPKKYYEILEIVIVITGGSFLNQHAILHCLVLYLTYWKTLRIFDSMFMDF